MDIEFMLEFNRVKEQWLELACTAYAKEQIRNTTYSLDETELRKRLRDTTEARQLMEVCGTPPIASIDEAKEIVQAAGKESCLTPYQLERIEKTLVAVRRLIDYLNRGMQKEISLAYYACNFDAMDGLREEIGRQIRGGAVDDYASKTLLSLRSEIAGIEEKMKRKAEQVMRSHKEFMADSFCTLRNGHICIPVKKEYRWKISGNAVDQSATGNTVFMEPAGVANLYEELQMRKLEEENEVRRILYSLTAMVADGAESMEENIRVMEKLDFIFSKGKLSMDMDAVPPEINLERRIRLLDARHPLMPKEVSVPLRFALGTEENGIVITGPNTGGKTVAIKTVALLCLMAQCGLHVTCAKADICMSSSFLCDIGDGQNIAENLSTFSAHIKNVLEIVKCVDGESLVVMDELGSGTDPTEGMGIAVSVLEELRKSGCLFLVTTHYPEIKEYAAKTARITNARMEFDRETLKPTYRLVLGEAGESCAFYIASKLGMPERMLKNAVRAAYGEAAVLDCRWEQTDAQASKKKPSRIKRAEKPVHRAGLAEKYHVGDSVMVMPDRKIGIVCMPVNEKGVLRVQLPGRKIWINHKRVKLHVAAEELYPADYDFSIIFDTVENRKIRHDMERKYTAAQIEYQEEKD